MLKYSYITPIEHRRANKEDIRGIHYYIYIESLTDRLNVLKLNEDIVFKEDKCFIEAYRHMKGLYSGELLDWQIFSRHGGEGYLYDILKKSHKDLTSKKILRNLVGLVEEKADFIRNDVEDEYTKSKITMHDLWFCNAVRSCVLKLSKEGLFDDTFFFDRTKNQVQYMVFDEKFIKSEIQDIESELKEVLKESKLREDADENIFNDFMLKWQFSEDRELIDKAKVG